MSKGIAIPAVVLLFLLGAVEMPRAQSIARSPVADGLKRADSLDSAGEYQAEEQELKRLLPTAGDDRTRGEINWRLARVYLNYGDAAKDAGKPDDQVIAIYRSGEAFADTAINQEPDSAEGYFWKSGNVGKVGLLRGVLNSLFMIPTVKDLLTKTISRDPNHHDAFFALGQLYAKVPGWPISFGNIDQAVSLARKSIDLMESDISEGKYPNPNYEFYTELANDLYLRNWNVDRRTKEQAAKRARYEAANDTLDKGLDYEGIASIPAEGDRREAIDILRKTIATIEGLSHPRASDLRVLKSATESLAAWSRA